MKIYWWSGKWMAGSNCDVTKFTQEVFSMEFHSWKRALTNCGKRVLHRTYIIFLGWAQWERPKTLEDSKIKLPHLRLCRSWYAKFNETSDPFWRFNASLSTIIAMAKARRVCPFSKKMFYWAESYADSINNCVVLQS